MPGGEQERGDAAQPLSDQNGLVEAELIDYCQHIGHLNLVRLAGSWRDADDAIVRGEVRSESLDNLITWCKWIGHMDQRPAEPGPVPQP